MIKFLKNVWKVLKCVESVRTINKFDDFKWFVFLPLLTPTSITIINLLSVYLNTNSNLKSFSR